ncbi:fungal-specific transcription factor domain-containing protein [Xylaria scruposa]|nr:fungal-specific transcription factor domain-containing protein [Xylaria scruposa]
MPDSDPDGASPLPSRQKPGAACEQCRRKKVRCDRQRPQCGFCRASGVECHVTALRPARGPKTGYLKSLQERIASLEEELLRSRQGEHGPTPMDPVNDFSPNGDKTWDFESDQNDWNFQAMLSAGTESCATSVEPGPCTVPPTLLQYTDDIISDDVGDNVGLPDIIQSGALIEAQDIFAGLHISTAMQADLDQLYFDRLHGCMPILNQRRYLFEAKQPGKSAAQLCLRYAVWTLASSTSVQYQGLRDPLYRNTRRSLEGLDMRTSSSQETDLEQVQAWLILATHEFMCVNFHRAWSTLGRAFRTIQLREFQDTDALDMVAEQTDPIATEMKRRTFWMAYCLDRFFSLRNGDHMTFGDQNLTRLPAPETDFQHGRPNCMGFLQDALTMGDFGPSRSPFVECILVAALSGRVLSHRHFCVGVTKNQDASQSCWERHERIGATLSRRIELFCGSYPPNLQESDPMLIFVNMMWQSAVLYHDRLTMLKLSQSDVRDTDLAESHLRASAAVAEMISLMTRISQMNGFKIHPLMQMPLSMCTEVLALHPEFGDLLNKRIQHVIGVMHECRNTIDL